MIGLEINDAVVLEQQQILEKALSTNPKTQKALQKLIREAIMGARADVVNSIKFANGDPRQSRRAVRTAVYKKILGANINIYNSRRGGSAGTISYERPRTLRPGQRGGNRRQRSERTKQIMGYGPMDRGFILRFVNSGTKTRVIGFRNTVKANRSAYEKRVTRISRGEKSNTGNRGSIAARNWFMQSAESALGNAAQTIADLIEIEAAAIARGEK